MRADAGPSPKPIKVKVRKPTVLTAPLGNAAAPILKAQRQAHANTQKAQRKVEARTTVPAVPKLKHPTSGQRGAAVSLVAGSLHKQGITTPSQVNALPKAQRVRVNRAAGYAQTNQRLVSTMPSNVTARAQLLPGKAHKRIGIPGVASIDLTTTERSIAKHLAGNPLSAVIKAVPEAAALTAKQKGVIGLSGRALQDAIDLPANTITSTYLVGKKAVEGHPGQAAKMLYDPIKQTVEHPVSSFSQHPLNTVLILRGVKGAAGHSIGKAMRVLPSETTRRLASTERPALTVPNMKRVTRRQYSRDVTSKAVQVATEKVKTRRAVAKGKPAPTHATAGDIRQNVAEDSAAARLQANRESAVVAHKAHKALGRKPTAATNLAAQGVTTADRASLEGYLKQVKSAEPPLKGDRLARNQETQRLIGKALKSHDLAKVQQAARAFQQFSATELEPKAIAARLVEPQVAEQARLEGVRLRRNGAAPDGATKQARKMAGKGEKVARLEAQHADAGLKQAQADALSAARVNGGRVPPAQHDVLLRAIERNDNAVKALAQRKSTATQARIAHTRQMLAPGEEPAYVSQQPIPPRTTALPTKRVTAKVKGERTGRNIRQGTLDVHPAKLVEQAQQTQRLITAARSREAFAEDYGYRPAGPDKPLQRFDTSAKAKSFAAKNGLEETWAPFKRQDGTTILVHKTALDEVKRFEAGTNVNPAVKSYTSRWRRVVLAFSPRWLTGNSFEAAVRSLAAGAGPASFITAKRSIAELRRIDPQRAAELEARALGGGNYSAAQRVAKERVTVQELGRLGKAGHAFWDKPGPAQLAGLYGAYTHFVFQTLNGRIEHGFQTVQFGRALRNHPLMSQHVVGLSAKAAHEAAMGLRDTATMAELGRAVDRMYGQYDKFSPGLRNAIANYTPFIAWTLNSVKFLTQVMPADHPVLTGLLTSANQATEGWRKQHGLYLDALGRTSGQLPGWLQGSVPGSQGSHLRLSRYTPAGLFTNDTGPLQGIASTLLPQYQEIVQNLGGKDWTGKDLSKHPNFARAGLAALVSFIEGQVPVTAQGVAVAGLTMPNDRSGTKHSSGGGTRAREQFDPFRYTPAKKQLSTKSSDPWAVPSSSGGSGWDTPSSTSAGGGWG